MCMRTCGMHNMYVYARARRNGHSINSLLTITVMALLKTACACFAGMNLAANVQLLVSSVRIISERKEVFGSCRLNVVSVGHPSSLWTFMLSVVSDRWFMICASIYLGIWTMCSYVFFCVIAIPKYLTSAKEQMAPARPTARLYKQIIKPLHLQNKVQRRSSRR